MTTLHRAKQLQNRTKKFAIRIVKAFARLPKDEATPIIGGNFSDREPRLLQITVPVVGRALAPCCCRWRADAANGNFVYAA